MGLRGTAYQGNGEGCITGDLMKNEVGGTCNTYRERRRAYRVLVQEPNVKRPLGRRRHRWDDIKMDVQEVG